MLMDMCFPKFDIYQGIVAPNCFKKHTNSWCPDFFSKKKKSVWALKKIIFKPDLKVKFHYNIAFSHTFIPIISKPMQDHILTNYFYSKIDTRMLKVDIWDHFPIFFTSKSINVKTSHDTVFVIKRDINSFTLSLLKEK